MGFDPQRDPLLRGAQCPILLSARALAVSMAISIGYWLVKHPSQPKVSRVRPHQHDVARGDEA
jgi:hypothetical protein